MAQRGRKSAASLATPRLDGRPARLRPPASLSEPERRVFLDLVGACDARHFVPSDLPLLRRYVEAVALGDLAAQELRGGAVVAGRVSPWVIVQEKSVRAMGLLSLRLRLSPQARIRTAKPAGQVSAYEQLGDDDVE
jgi:hypothetical protein